MNHLPHFCKGSYKKQEPKKNFLWKKKISSTLNFSFTNPVLTRATKIVKMSGEIATDEQLNSPVGNFRIKMYYSIIDIVIDQITERFIEDSIPLFKDILFFK